MTQSTLPQFVQLTIQGEDAAKFLQGQLTSDVTKLGLSYQATALSNLKGRIDFGLWIKKQEEKHFDVVISADCADAFQAHLKSLAPFQSLIPVHQRPFILAYSMECQPLVIKTSIILSMTLKRGCRRVLQRVIIG